MMSNEEEIILGPSTVIQLSDDPLGSGFKTIISDSVKGDRWQVNGKDTQVLTTLLEPNQSIECEPGSMMFMHPSIEQDVDCGCDTCWSRCMAGENCAKSIYTNAGHEKNYIGLAPYYPAGIIPIAVGKLAGDAFVTKSGAYMANIGQVDVGYSCHCCSIETLCCTGLGCVRQELSGTASATAFLSAAGTILVKDLGKNETVVIDSNSIVGYDKSVSSGVRPSGKCGVCLCGGEGCVNSTLTGPGKIYLQSTSFEKMKLAWTPPPQNNNMGSGGDADDED